jgi:spore coat polysaccharide biosynthesis protein SpsF
VLDRYVQAAREFNADPIIRITGDCPLIAPEVVERVIGEYTSGSCDYVVTGPSFAEGFDCEIFSAKMLQLSAEGAAKKSEREHITLYMNAHPEVCKKLVLQNAQDDGHYRVTVDEPVDFTVAQSILEALYPSNPNFTGEDVKRFLDEHPEIAAINTHVVRNEGLLKSLAAEK